MDSVVKGRSVYIWGAGSRGSEALRSLEGRMKVAGFVDSDALRWGSRHCEFPIVSPEVLKCWAQDFSIKPFVVIASAWSSEIVPSLESFGFRCASDYAIFDGSLDLRNAEGSLLMAELDSLTLENLPGFSDEEWFWMNTQGYREHAHLRELLSPLPDDQIQIRLTGVAGDQSLRHAFNQYQVIKELLQRSRLDLSGMKSILDFGCGYGRILRYFVKDSGHARLVGTDIDRELVRWSRTNNKFGEYHLNSAEPPTDFGDGEFSMIFAFSVYSHLSERSHMAWKEEMSRILEKGGILVFTVWAHPAVTIEYHRPHFPDYPKLVSDYEQGRFCYSNLLYGGSETYAEALVPRAYIQTSWSDRFELIDFTENHPKSPNQNYMMMRKK